MGETGLERAREGARACDESLEDAVGERTWTRLSARMRRNSTRAQCSVTNSSACDVAARGALRAAVSPANRLLRLRVHLEYPRSRSSPQRACRKTAAAARVE